MANVLGELFGDIAAAIREKTGDTASMKPAEFPDQIRAIEVGGGSGGGGTLPAGVYWEVLDIPRPNNYYQRWFEYQGDLYAITNRTTGTAAIGYIYKLVNGAWTAVVSGLNLTTTDAYNIGLTEFNGKIHMCGGESTHHYIFDGTSLTRMADVANRLAKSMFVHNNQLKAYSYYDGTVYVWDEASDTWTAEATPGSKYDYYEFYNVNGIIYVYRSNNLYIYDNGTLTQIGSWSGTPGKIAIFDDTLCGLAWQSNRPYVLTQYDFATNQYRTIGTIPHYNSQTTLFEYQGRLCALAPNNTDYFAAWVLHEVAAA